MTCTMMKYTIFFKKKERKLNGRDARVALSCATQEDKTELINFYDPEILRRWQTDIGGAVI